MCTFSTKYKSEINKFSFGSPQIYLKYLDTDTMRGKAEISIWNIWAPIKWEPKFQNLIWPLLMGLNQLCSRPWPQTEICSGSDQCKFQPTNQVVSRKKQHKWELSIFSREFQSKKMKTPFLNFGSDAGTLMEAMDWSDLILHLTSPSHKDVVLLYYFVFVFVCVF